MSRDQDKPGTTSRKGAPARANYVDPQDPSRPPVVFVAELLASKGFGINVIPPKVGRLASSFRRDGGILAGGASHRAGGRGDDDRLIAGRGILAGGVRDST